MSRQVEGLTADSQFDALLSLVAEDEGERHGNVELFETPENHRLLKPDTIHDNSPNYRGTRPYRFGRVVASILDNFVENSRKEQ